MAIVMIIFPNSVTFQWQNKILSIACLILLQSVGISNNESLSCFFLLSLLALLIVSFFLSKV